MGGRGGDSSRGAVGRYPRLRLHAATAIGDPGMISIPSGDLPGQLDAERTGARAELDKAVADAFPGGPPKDFEARLVEGDPSDSLVAEAGAAELIVVGSRGRGGLKSALSGP